MRKSKKDLSNDSIEALQNDDARKIMDTVDQLRKVGLGTIVQLPQLVTVGDQSSGKSSTLEAITGISFPRKESLCTRFATQIVMRRAATELVSVAILPDKLRPTSEREHLAALHLSLGDFDNLGDLIDRATHAMGLNGAGDGNTKAFARDVLNIEVSGPTRPQLTLVDLPGLIHSATKQQTRADVELITNLVEEYIKEERTIVLAVVAANNDYANQIVLNKARDLDGADRTLGVVTKVDFLGRDTDNEKQWLDLAQNKDVYFGLGWHMLRNRTPTEMNSTLAEGDSKEAQFFATGNHRQLDRGMVGVETLRTRLSDLLAEHLQKELPSLQREVHDKHAIVSDFSQRARAASSYDEPFFANINSDKPVSHPANIVRIRAAVQDANLQFAAQMRQYGAKFQIAGMPMETSDTDSQNAKEPSLSPEYSRAKSRQTKLEFKKALDWVQDVLERCRGLELPGNFNPRLIGMLFHEQSDLWADLASDHVDRVGKLCERFVKLVLKDIATSDVYDRIWSLVVEPALAERVEKAHSELDKIIKDKNGHPITYNHYYTTTIQKMRVKRQEQRMITMVGQNSEQIAFGVDDESISHVRSETLKRKFTDAFYQEDMDVFSAEDALTCQVAYYKDELKYFVNCVTKQVIERHLLDELATEIISAYKFGMMSTEDIKTLASEPSNIMQKREHLRREQALLQKGIKQFRSAAGNF